MPEFVIILWTGFVAAITTMLLVLVAIKWKAKKLMQQKVCNAEGV